MDKGSPPPAPDYMGLAEQQGQNSLDLAKLTNVNVQSPYGSQTYYEQTTDPTAYKTGLENQLSDIKAKMPVWENWDWRYANDFVNGDRASERAAQWFTNTTNQYNTQMTDLQRQLDEFNKTGLVPSDTERPTLIQKFSPEQQALYDQQNKIKQLLGGLGIQGAEALQGVVGRNLDLSGLPQQPGSYGDTRKSVIDAYMSRANEDYGKQTDNANSNMIAAGIHPGNKAYADQMQMIERSRNDARQQAEIAGGNAAQQAFGMDTSRRAQGLSELLAQRQTPLNEINALLSGSQVSNPFVMPGFNGSQPGGTPYMQAGQLGSQYQGDLYNLAATNAANTNAGLFGLGAAGLGALGSYLGS